MRLLQLDETRDCAEIVTEMQIAGRLHAGKNALGELRRGRRHRDSSDAPPYVSRQAAAQARRRLPRSPLVHEPDTRRSSRNPVVKTGLTRTPKFTATIPGLLTPPSMVELTTSAPF
jgi:hypothetical protein